MVFFLFSLRYENNDYRFDIKGSGVFNFPSPFISDRVCKTLTDRFRVTPIFKRGSTYYGIHWQATSTSLIYVSFVLLIEFCRLKDLL